MITSIKPPGGSCRANESILSLPREARPHFLLCRFFRLQVHFGIPKLTHIEELHAGHFVPKLPDPITGQGAPGANGPEATMKMAGSLEVAAISQKLHTAFWATSASVLQFGSDCENRHSSCLRVAAIGT